MRDPVKVSEAQEIKTELQTCIVKSHSIDPVP
jgi:hypothetical protein